MQYNNQEKFRNIFKVPSGSSACLLERSLPNPPLLCESSNHSLHPTFFPQKTFSFSESEEYFKKQRWGLNPVLANLGPNLGSKKTRIGFSFLLLDSAVKSLASSSRLVDVLSSHRFLVFVFWCHVVMISHHMCLVTLVLLFWCHASWHALFHLGSQEGGWWIWMLLCSYNLYPFGICIFMWKAVTNIVLFILSFQGIVRPDPFYVDQAINTLEHLIEMGIPTVCNSWLTLPPCPDIVSIDSLYSAASRWGCWWWRQCQWQGQCQLRQIQSQWQRR